MPDTTCVNALLRRLFKPAAITMGVAALFTPARADVTVTPATKGYDIAITDQASASDVLDAITSATGVAVKGEPGDDAVNPTRLTGVSLERALPVAEGGICHPLWCRRRTRHDHIPDAQGWRCGRCRRWLQP